MNQDTGLKAQQRCPGPATHKPTAADCRVAGAFHDLSLEQDIIPRSTKEAITGWRCMKCNMPLTRLLSLRMLSRICAPKQGFCPNCYPHDGSKHSTWDSAEAMFEAIDRRRHISPLSDRTVMPPAHAPIEWHCNRCGFEFWANRSNVLWVSGCPRCARPWILTKTDYDRLGEAVKITLAQAAPPDSGTQLVKWQCGCNAKHKFKKSYAVISTLLRGGFRVCPHCPSGCKGKSRRFDDSRCEAEYHVLAAKFKGRCRGPFPPDANQRTNWRCEKGDLIIASYNQIRRRLVNDYVVCLLCAGIVLSERQPIETSPDQEEAHRLREEARQALTVKLDQSGLPGRSIQVIKLRRGLGDDPVPKTLAEVGQMLQITYEWVRKIQAQAIRDWGPV